MVRYDCDRISNAIDINPPPSRLLVISIRAACSFILFKYSQLPTLMTTLFYKGFINFSTTTGFRLFAVMFKLNIFLSDNQRVKNFGYKSDGKLLNNFKRYIYTRKLIPRNFLDRWMDARSFRGMFEVGQVPRRRFDCRLTR